MSRPISVELRNWLHALVLERGTTLAAARRVGLSPGAFASAAAGLPVQTGTRAQIELTHLQAEAQELIDAAVA